MSQSQQTVISAKEAMIRLGSIINFVAGLFQFFVGIRFIGLVNSGDVLLASYLVLFLGGVMVIVLSILQFATEWITIKINPLVYTIIILIEFIITYFVPPEGSSAALSVEIGNTIGMFGIFFLFVALRPNFGPTANKKIYQAVAGIMAFAIAIFLLVLGIYVSALLDITAFAGRGTYPQSADNFYYFFIESIPNQQGVDAYNQIRFSGTLMILTAVYIMLIVVIRNKITLKLSSILLLAGIVWTIADIIVFDDQWRTLDNLFYQTPSLQPDYYTTLKLSDPGVVTTGVVIVLLFGISLLMMIYASFAAKPIAAWRRKRDSSIAAAEVFFREGKLPSAVKYLEQAAQLSSKIDEEDKAVELLTRIKQIKDKAIKMKKAEAAEKAKKAYEKQQKEVKAQESKGRRDQQTSKSKVKAPAKEPSQKKPQKEETTEDKLLKEKMREAMKKE